MAVLHEDNLNRKLVRQNAAALLSIGMPLSKMAEGCKVNSRRFQAFMRSEGNLTDEEVQALLMHFKKIKKYIEAMLK